MTHEGEPQEQIMLRNFTRRDSPTESVLWKIRNYLSGGRLSRAIEEERIRQLDRQWRISAWNKRPLVQSKESLDPPEILRRRALIERGVRNLGPAEWVATAEERTEERRKIKEKRELAQQQEAQRKTSQRVPSKTEPNLADVVSSPTTQMASERARNAAAAQQGTPVLPPGFQVPVPPESQRVYPPEFYRGGRGNYPVLPRGLQVPVPPIAQRTLPPGAYTGGISNIPRGLRPGGR